MPNHACRLAGDPRPLWRRLFAITLAAALAVPLPAPDVAAQGAAPPAKRTGPLEVEITQGVLKPIPVAITEFVGDDPRLGGELADVVAADLERSGLFQPLDRAAFIERIRDPSRPPRFPDWRAIGAQAIVVGRLSRTPEGRARAEFRLWDVLSGRQLVGQQFTADPRQWRRMAHLIADQIYQRLTGEKGYFDTRIVFVDETGPKDKRVKRLAIMDQDGANVRLLTQGRDLALTPRFSPTRQEIAYMHYSGAVPSVYLLNLASGERQPIGNFPGMTFAPRFSPDGRRIVLSLQSEGNTSIYEMDLSTRMTRRLTAVQAIDTGPCYSPDGRSIVFESDREGTQQLYVMGTDGNGARRVSHGEGRYSTPVWSPRGDLIAFTKQSSGRFLIGVMRPDGSGERILTDGYHNEGPTWAPNGRVLMFFREARGQGGPRLYSIDLTGYNERQVKTPSFASDPAWSPLLE